MRALTLFPGESVRKIGLTKITRARTVAGVPADPLPDWVPVRRRAVGLRIARARQRQGLAVDDLAGLSGLDRKTIMTAESGRHAPTLDTLLLIAHGLGIPAAMLLTDESPAAGTGITGGGTG